MARLLSVERLAPELKASREALLVTTAAALVVFGLALFGYFEGAHLKGASAGTSQVVFNSTEPFGKAPGARLFYVPEKGTFVIRGWLFDTLGASGVYQVWAATQGGYRSLGTADAIRFVGFAMVAEGNLEDVRRVIITREPPGGSSGAPRGPTVVELVN